MEKVYWENITKLLDAIASLLLARSVSQSPFVKISSVWYIMTTTWKPHDNLMTTSSWQPLDNLIMATSWQPYDNLMTTLWEPHENLMRTSLQPHDNNMTILWQQYDNIMTTSNHNHDNIMKKASPFQHFNFFQPFQPLCCQPEIEIASIDHFWSCLLFIRRSDVGGNPGTRWVRGNDFCLGRAVTWFACRHEDSGFGDEGMTWPDLTDLTLM